MTDNAAGGATGSAGPLSSSGGTGTGGADSSSSSSSSSAPADGDLVLAVTGNKTLIAPKFNKYLAWGWPDRSLRVCIQITSPRYPRVGAAVAVHGASP